MPEETVDCSDPRALAAAACGYCYDEETWRKVMVYLLAVIAEKDDLTPAQLAKAAACKCIPAGQFDRVMAYLLCEAVNAA